MDHRSDRRRPELRPICVESLPADRSVPEPEPDRVAGHTVADGATSERERVADGDDPDLHPARPTDPKADQDALVPVAAIALITDERGRVLLVKQTGGPFAGSWLLPGGRAGDDESAVHALVREVREETGLTMTDAVYVTGYRTSGDGYDLTVLMYQGPATGTLVPERGSDARWFDVAAIPDPHPALRRQLHDAGMTGDDDAAITVALDGAGIEMARLA
jgi:8-oxo-dGTP diphosphatase